MLTLNCAVPNTDGMRGKIPHFKINKGNDMDMEYMLDKRCNLVHYVHLIDIYAPCIVGHSNWNDKANMTRYCGESGALFNDFVFSISDEAFVLLVLLNYTKTWMSELEFEQAKVSAVRATLWLITTHVYSPVATHVALYGSQIQANVDGMVVTAVNTIVVSLCVLQCYVW